MKIEIEWQEDSDIAKVNGDGFNIKVVAKAINAIEKQGRDELALKLAFIRCVADTLLGLEGEDDD